jgi:hypothetical protein
MAHLPGERATSDTTKIVAPAADLYVPHQTIGPIVGLHKGRECREVVRHDCCDCALEPNIAKLRIISEMRTAAMFKPRKPGTV